MLPFDSTLANFGAIASILGLAILVIPYLLRKLRKYMTMRKQEFEIASSFDDTENLSPSPKVNLPIASQKHPASTESLNQMLEAAKAVLSSSARSNALRIVAEHAVEYGDYGIAIKAGVSDNSSIGSSNTLSYVAVKAAEKGAFKQATQAANAIPSSSMQGETTVKILRIQQKRQS